MRDDLTPRERQILAFERKVWTHWGAREAAVRSEFDVSLTRYAQELNALIDRPEALAHAPQVVWRLRRLREHRRATRAS